MNKDKREYDYPVELESQLIMRLPEEPAKSLRELLRSGENLKNRLTIKLENDMRYGEVRFDHWLLHSKIVDLPTIVESLKTIDKKNAYKTADICQLMICKEEKEPASTDDELPTKNKKKDSLKVDKKFLWPHGLTPPTKNIRRRRFRKTLKKKSAEAPDIEKEVKRLLRADIEAVSSTWEIIQEDNDHNVISDSSVPIQTEKVNTKKERNYKVETIVSNPSSSKVEDIFGGAVSDSDIEDDVENVNVDIDDSKLSSYIENMDLNKLSSVGNPQVTQFKSEMFHSPQTKSNMSEPSTSFGVSQYYQQSNKNDIKLQQLSADLEELKQRKQRTLLEISGMENVTLRQRFKDILHTINQDIIIKEIELKNLQSLY